MARQYRRARSGFHPVSTQDLGHSPDRSDRGSGSANRRDRPRSENRKERGRERRKSGQGAAPERRGRPARSRARRDPEPEDPREERAGRHPGSLVRDQGRPGAARRRRGEAGGRGRERKGRERKRREGKRREGEALAVHYFSLLVPKFCLGIFFSGTLFPF